MIARLAVPLAFVSLITSADFSKADIIKCSYTEPFITTTYSSTTNDLIISENAQPDVRLTNISLQIIRQNLFELWDAKHEVIQRMELNLKGYDGMSDMVYPYDAIFLPRQLRGGCISNHLH